MLASMPEWEPLWGYTSLLAVAVPVIASVWTSTAEAEADRVRLRVVRGTFWAARERWCRTELLPLEVRFQSLRAPQA